MSSKIEINEKRKMGEREKRSGDSEEKNERDNKRENNTREQNIQCEFNNLFLKRLMNFRTERERERRKE